MSTEGGGGNKPKSWPDTQGKKQEPSQEIKTTLSQVGETKGKGPTETKQTTKDPSKTGTLKESSVKGPKDTRTASDILSDQTEERPRQVIAVSASKGPAAFFNLARKFLVTDEMCDLSALEGAIVSAVDAAHLLERSKLATIIRIQTSYVAVGPKRKKNTAVSGTVDLKAGPSSVSHPTPVTASKQGAVSAATILPSKPVSTTMAMSSEISQSQGRSFGKSKDSAPSGKELRRARMIITVRRTDDYKKWLDENPLQDLITGDHNVVESTSESRSHPAK